MRWRAPIPRSRIGDATPGWETQRAVMHVAPADAADAADRLAASV
ncbi:hypothetical protein [Nonomuraea gerenzanensis]|uniref:Uncharacterized protein n=1 Tax=Nonomuraea gerenzanensis TaxID=93944 RepID=A0A1M4EJ41_9ACTN|nr:hypothetical protein [Nonomuraea gerenzanensis]SBO98718.1 hypothetical protein BN4615_P8234 [Nonomuraea gerenzanensis]